MNTIGLDSEIIIRKYYHNLMMVDVLDEMMHYVYVKYRKNLECEYSICEDCGRFDCIFSSFMNIYVHNVM